MISNQDQFTPGEVATLRGISTKTVLRAINAGELKAHRYSAKTVRIARQDLERWLDACQRRAMSHLSQNGASSAKRIHSSSRPAAAPAKVSAVHHHHT
jgi:excisionase family DNA binding protein